eukprot:gene8144-9674_t
MPSLARVNLFGAEAAKAPYEPTLEIKGLELMLVHREDFQLILNSSMISDMSQKILFLQSMPVLEKAPRHQLNALACNMEVRSLPTGTVLAVEGKPADHMFFIKSGFVKLHSSSTELARPQKQPANRKSASQSPAAEKQASNAKRECRVKGVWKKLSEYEVVAETDNSPVDISMLGPGEMCGEDLFSAQGNAEIDKVLIWYHSRVQIAHLLQMSQLQPHDLDVLVNLTKKNRFLSTLERKAGVPCFLKGDVGDSFYIILSGSMAIQDPDTDFGHDMDQHEIRGLGEYAVLHAGMHTMTAVALTTVEVYSMSAEEFKVAMTKLQVMNEMKDLSEMKQRWHLGQTKERSNPLEQGSSRRELLPLSRSEASIGQQTSGEAAGEISVDDEILALKGFNDVILKMNNRQSQGRRWGHWTPQVDPPASIAEIQKGVNYNLASLMTPVGTVDKLLRPAISGGYVTPIQYPKRLEMRTGLWKSKPAKIAISERDEKTAEVKQNISRFFGR